MTSITQFINGKNIQNLRKQKPMTQEELEENQYEERERCI